MSEAKEFKRLEALIYRKRLRAAEDRRVLTEQALAELHRLLMYLDPDSAKYLAPSTDPDVLAVLKEIP